FGSPWDIAPTLVNIRGVAYGEGNVAAARGVLEACIGGLQKTGDPRVLGSLYLELGMMEQETGQHERARGASERALALLEECGDQRGVAIALAILGNAATARREFIAAYHHLARSLATAQGSVEPGDIPFV